MLSINTNLSSLIAQNSMKTSSFKLDTAIERMSTGCKINHAKDNAANYSISTNMTTKIGAYQVAEDNALQGLDMINTASESLTLIEDKLMRLRALAEQSANGTYGAQSKQAINQEANAIVDEIERLYNTTEYNGIKLLDNGIKMWENTNAPSVSKSGFVEEVQKRDTSAMKKLSEVVDKTVSLQDGEYSISTPEEMVLLSEMANAGLISAGDTFVLANDIDLSKQSIGNDWKPINGFSGAFDGNGYVIKNLYVNNQYGWAGLFGGITGAKIKNLGVIAVDLTGLKNVGGIVCWANNSVIENCYSTGVIKCTEGSADEYFGGLIGGAIGVTVKNSYAKVDVQGYNFVGGLIGGAGGSNEFENCFSCGTVKGNQDAGGFIGNEYGTAGKYKNCYTNSFVSAKITVAGGFAGSVNTTVEFIDCFTLGNTECLDGDVSGFCANGKNITLTNCYATGDVISVNGLVGGLLGKTWGAVFINNCYTTSNLQGACVGGIVGASAYKQISIVDTYMLAEVDNLKGLFLGEFVKFDDSPGFDVTNSYYSNLYDDKPLVGGVFDPSLVTSSNTSSIEFNKKIYFQVGCNKQNENQISLDMSVSINNLNSLKNSVTNNRMNLMQIDEFLAKVSQKQTEFGAGQNRLESVVEEIGIQYDNLVSSRSTLRDADIAEVSAEYIQQEILQQASATLLATANQSPAIALQLI